MKPKPPRRWRRWLWRLAIAALVARLLLAAFLPQVLAFAASFAGLTMSVRSASLSLLGLSLHLEDVVVHAADQREQPPLLVAQDVLIDLSLRHLLFGQLAIVDAAVASARVHVVRNRDGTLRLPASWTATATATVSAPAPAMPRPRLSFASPLLVASARLHDVTLRVQEEGSTEQPQEVTVDVDVRDVGHLHTAGEVLVRMHSPRWLDDAWLRVHVSNGPNHFDVTWEAVMQGLRPTTLSLPANVTTLLGNAHAFGLRLHGRLTGDVQAARPSEARLAGNVRLTMHGDGDEQLNLLAAIGPSTVDDDGSVIPFALDVQAKDWVRQLRVVDGQVRRARDELTLRGTLAADGLTLARTHDALRAAGVHWPADGVQLRAGFEVLLGETLSATLRDVELQHAEERVRLPLASLRGLSFAKDGLAMDAIEVRGPELVVHQTTSEALTIAGITLAAPRSLAAPSTTHAAPTLPRLRLGSLSWTDLRATFRDARLDAALTVDAFSLRGDAITLGHIAPPGRLALSARVVDAIDAVHLAATLAATASTLETELELTATGLTGKALTPWLQRLGITPTWRAGTLQAVAKSSFAVAGDVATIDLQVANLRLLDGEKVLLRVRHVSGDGLQFGNAGRHFGSWRLDEPFLAVQRDEQMAMHLLGLRFAPSTTGPPAHEVSATPPPAAAMPWSHGPLTVQSAVIRWQDSSDVQPTALGFDVVIGAADDNGIPIDATVRLEGAIDRAHVRGHVNLREPMQLALTVDANGVRGEGLQRFLPPSVRNTMVDGEVHGQFAASHRSAPSATTSLRLDDLFVRDRGEELAAIDHLQIELGECSREKVHLVDLAGRGLRAKLSATADGLHVPGFLLRPVAATTSTAPPRPAADRASPSQSLRLPALQIDALSLACESLTVHDRRSTDGQPVALSFHLTMSPWAPKLDSDEPAAAQLVFTATALPLCQQVRAEVSINPFLLQPTVDVALTASGLDLTALPRVLPQLATTLQGTTTNADFRAALHARLDLKRRDGRQLDLGRPFAGEFLLENVELRDHATTQVLAAIASLDATLRSLDPSTGDALLRSLHIDDPRLDIKNSEHGVELLGVRLLPATAANDGPTSEPSTPTDSAPAPEFAIDRLQVQGLGLTVTDTTTSPVTLLPIVDGTFTLQRFTTRWLTEPLPLSFAVSLRGGEVPLARRVLSSSMLAGVFGSAVAAIGGGDDQHEVEPRPFVDELTSTGHLQWFPQLRGDVRTQISGFELTALRGLAKRSGVDIADGVLDYSLLASLRGHDGMDITSNKVFSWLSLSEPPGGPISTYLRLPAPLDTVLFLLRNDDDEHRIPVQLHIPATGLSSGAVLETVTAAIARILADAVASAAARTTGMLTGAIGLGGATAAPVRCVVPFAAGDPLPGDADVTPLLAALASDDQLEVVCQHELGEGDRARAAALATPPLPTMHQQADQLRARRDQLAAGRTAKAAALAALYAAGRMQEARARQAELQAHDDQLGETERTLDELFAMLGEANPRAARRRIAAAAEALGQARLVALIDQLRGAAPDLNPARWVAKPPRGIVGAGLPVGGQVVLTIRRRNAP